jgi:hypothetical protein
MPVAMKPIWPRTAAAVVATGGNPARPASTAMPVSAHTLPGT